MVTITVCCQYCGSEDLKRNGHAENGKQRYYCKTCKKQSRENPTPQAYSEERKEEIIRSYQERSSLRGLTRTFGVARNTVTGWLKKKAEKTPELRETLVKPDENDPEATDMELDELWSFVLKKSDQAWVWIALCIKTKQVVAYAVGDRTEETCRKLCDAIPEEYRSGHCFSDFWRAYQLVIPKEKHSAVGKETGKTAHIERFNNTLRQRLGRFVRKTLSFSKSTFMHDICLHLFFYRYNLERASILS
jgi:insertion element IS1 protein InsB